MVRQQNCICGKFQTVQYEQYQVKYIVLNNWRKTRRSKAKQENDARITKCRL